MPGWAAARDSSSLARSHQWQARSLFQEAIRSRRAPAGDVSFMVDDQCDAEAYDVRVDKHRAFIEQALIDFCRAELTGYKVPKHVYFRDELPKTNVGKILRRALRDQLPKAQN